MLGRLDQLERRPFILDRQRIHIVNSNAVVEECWCYHLVNHRKELEKLPHIDDYDTNGPHGKPYIPNSLEICNDFTDVQCVN